MKPSLVHARGREEDFHDAWLPNHWKARRLVDELILVESKPTLLEKLLLAPFCIGVGVFMAHHAVKEALTIPLVALLIALIFGGIALGGLHLLFRRERWTIGQNSLIVERSSFWCYHRSSYTDATLTMNKEEREDGEFWRLEVARDGQKTWLYSGYNRTAAWFERFADMGWFLHEHTGWSLISSGDSGVL